MIGFPFTNLKKEESDVSADKKIALMSRYLDCPKAWFGCTYRFRQPASFREGVLLIESAFYRRKTLLDVPLGALRRPSLRLHGTACPKIRFRAITQKLDLITSPTWKC
jgi:hypothetical protein